MNIKGGIILVLTGLMIIFIIQNVAAVEVTFLFWSISLSRSILILLTLAIGFVLGWFLHSHFPYRQSEDQFPGDI